MSRRAWWTDEAPCTLRAAAPSLTRTGPRQFDILWDGLTAAEHLRLFAAIKGIPAAAAASEAQRRIEEVCRPAAFHRVGGRKAAVQHAPRQTSWGGPSP